MPIYEFECQECGNEFEALVRLNEEYRVVCPRCQAANLKKKISRTASAKKECASCSSGSCGSGGFT